MQDTIVSYEIIVYIFSSDISGSPISVDVGRCRSHCGGAPRTSLDSGLQEYSKHSSMLEYLRSKKVSDGVSVVPQTTTRESSNLGADREERKHWPTKHVYFINRKNNSYHLYLCL